MAPLAAFQLTERAPSRLATDTISTRSGALEGWGVATAGWEGLPSQPPSVAATVKQ